jgi:hypothetical protein
VKPRFYRELGTAEFGAEDVHDSVGQRATAAGYRPPNTVGRHLARCPWKT